MTKKAETVDLRSDRAWPNNIIRLHWHSDCQRDECPQFMKLLTYLLCY